MVAHRPPAVDNPNMFPRAARELAVPAFVFPAGGLVGAAFFHMSMTFPPMPDWFPDFVREIMTLSAALTPAEFRELDAMLAQDEARAEAARAARDSEKQKRQSLARFIAKAKQLSIDVTVEPNGAVTFHTGTVSTPVDKSQTELDEWIAKHAH
jgi:hypothetical protein